MTLPASENISLGQVASELGVSLPLSLGDARVRALVGKSSGNISLGDAYSKTRFRITTGLFSFDAYTYSNGATAAQGTCTPAADARLKILQITGDAGNNNGRVSISLNGTLPKTAFTSMNINGTEYLTANAVLWGNYTAPMDGHPLATVWQWTSTQAVANFSAYDVFIN